MDQGTPRGARRDTARAGVRNRKQQLARCGELAVTGVTTQSWYLRSGGRANSLSGNGFVSLEKPRESEPADYYFYDPAAPVQSLGGHSCCYPQATPMGPIIQRDVELRNDVLVYSRKPLEQPLWVAGTVTARLFAATSARDTDWVVKLCDVAPDGRSLNIQEGVIRARFRNGFERATLLEPDSVDEYTITVGACCHQLRGRPSDPHPGDQQQLSCHRPQPEHRRPARHGEVPFEWELASQTVFHDAAHPSCVFLPVVSRLTQ